MVWEACIVGNIFVPAAKNFQFPPLPINTAWLHSPCYVVKEAGWVISANDRQDVQHLQVKVTTKLSQSSAALIPSPESKMLRFGFAISLSSFWSGQRGATDSNHDVRAERGFWPLLAFGIFSCLLWQDAGQLGWYTSGEQFRQKPKAKQGERGDKIKEDTKRGWGAPQVTDYEEEMGLGDY